jgi:hypothetical protein
LFNLRHSSLRVTIESAFAALKNVFKILWSTAIPSFPHPSEACSCMLHFTRLDHAVGYWWFLHGWGRRDTVQHWLWPRF